ncbi:hypothetical protein HanOQP8_Chr05g0175531 [Helianthus annuus]|nr:hypothetical protein HanOQP8_Chr05g0175531 [Helianthus annuus]
MNLKTKMLDHQPCVSKNCRMWSFILSTIKLFSLLNLNEQIWFLNWVCWFAISIDVCRHPFSFSPVYAENALARLPFQVLHFLLCLSFVLCILPMVIPFVTFWVWRLSYVRSYNEAQGLLLSHIAIAEIVTNLFKGILFSAFIMYDFLWSTFLRYSFRHVAGVGQMIRRFVGYVVARWEMQVARLEQMFNGLDDGGVVLLMS